MKEIICPNCGKSNPPEAEFCSNCFTLLKDRTGKNPEPAENESPEWLKKIRERSQAELSSSPPLGEYGDVESRSNDDGKTSDEVPEWLREIQKNSPDKPEESEEPASDWMTRLHDILPHSEQKSGQSTTFFSEDELAARAVAERQSLQDDLLPPDHAPTQPVDLPRETPPDFEFHSSNSYANAEAESDFIESLNGFGGSDKSDIPSSEPDDRQGQTLEPEVMKPQKNDFRLEEEPGSRVHTHQPEESESKPDLEAAPEYFPVQEASSSDKEAIVEPEKEVAGPPIPGQTAPEEIPVQGQESLPQTEPGQKLFAGLFGKKEEPDQNEQESDKPEKLIPEGVLQPQYNRSVEYSGRLEISDRQRMSISLLKNMLMGEIQAQEPDTSKGRISGKAIRLIIGIILLSAMLIPLITGYTFVGEQALFSPGVVAMHNAVSALPENSPFLIISDYEPAFSGELRESATGVIDHLMDRKLNFSILSTVPSGPALAHDLIDAVRPLQTAYPVEKIAFLGYLPGGTTGLRDFVRNPREAMPLLEDGRYAWTDPAAVEVISIEDYSGVLIITENTETGRAWIEQLHGSLNDKPVMMVVSAQSAPLMRPYLDSDQLNGLVGGRVEGAMYDRIMESPPRSPSIMAAYQAGMILAAGLMLFGGFYGILLGLFNHGTKSSMEDFHVS